MANTQNTRTVTSETLTEVIKPAHLRKLMRFSRATGYSLSPVLNRALELWLDVEGPVYLAHAKQAHGQRA